MSVPAGVMTGGSGNMDPQTMSQIMQLANSPQQYQMLQQQMARANALRNTPMPGLSQGWRSNVVTAPSPLATIGSLAMAGAGQKQANMVQQATQKQMQQDQANREKYMDVIRGMYQRNGMPMSAGGGSSTGAGPQADPSGNGPG